MAKATSSPTMSRRNMLATAALAPIAAAVPMIGSPAKATTALLLDHSPGAIKKMVDMIYARYVESEFQDSDIRNDSVDVLTPLIGDYTIGDVVALFNAQESIYNAEADELSDEDTKAFSALSSTLHRFIFEGAAATARDAISRIVCGLEDENGHENWYNADAFSENSLRDLARIQAEGIAWVDDSPQTRFKGWIAHALPLPGTAPPTAEEVEAEEQRAAQERLKAERMHEEDAARQVEIKARMPADRAELIERYDDLPPRLQRRAHFVFEIFFGENGIERESAGGAP